MSKKADKSKEKKAAKKEEAARLIAVAALFRQANSVKDPVSQLLPAFERVRMRPIIDSPIPSDKVLKMRHYTSDTIPSNVFTSCFNILKENMHDLYEAAGKETGWGWSDREKKEELRHADARFLIVVACHSTDESSQEYDTIVGFTHYRFLEEESASGAPPRPVVYCYEIQISSPFRRLGIGRHLMLALEVLARSSGMSGVILTVLKSNPSAIHFYLDTLKYSLDEISPTLDVREFDEEGKELVHVILSKIWVPVASKITS